MLNRLTRNTISVFAGGTFALYSLICRYAKTSLIPNQQIEDRQISNYQLQLPGRRLRRASILKSWLENNLKAKYLLLFTTMLGTSMVIGDGIVTPSISGKSFPSCYFFDKCSGLSCRGSHECSVISCWGCKDGS